MYFGKKMHFRISINKLLHFISIHIPSRYISNLAVFISVKVSTKILNLSKFLSQKLMNEECKVLKRLAVKDGSAHPERFRRIPVEGRPDQERLQGRREEEDEVVSLEREHAGHFHGIDGAKVRLRNVCKKLSLKPWINLVYFIQMSKPLNFTFCRQLRYDEVRRYEEEMAATTPRTALRQLNPANLSDGGGNSRDHASSIPLWSPQFKCSLSSNS